MGMYALELVPSCVAGGIGELGPRDDCVEATAETGPGTDGVGETGWIQVSGNGSRGQARALS